MQESAIRVRAFEFHVVQKVTAQLARVRHAKDGGIRDALSGLQRKFAREPAGGAIGADAALRQRMLEADKPGAGGDWRSFHLAGNDGPGHDGVDQNDLREREGFVQSA